MTLTTPYTPPEDYRHKGESLYDAEVRYADEWVGSLIESWNKFCQKNDNMIIITADHGEGLGEHGEKYHGHFLFDTTLHVPLILFGSNIEHEIRDDIVGLYDIFPTILKYCCVKNRENTESPAIDLLSRIKREIPVLSETQYPEILGMNISRGYTIRQNDLKIICQPKTEKFNLANDPKELYPILTNTTELKNLLYATVKDLRASKSNPKRMDDETIAKIMSLGYLGSQPTEIPLLNRPVFPHMDWISPVQATNFIDRTEKMFRMSEESDERLAMMEKCYEIDPKNEFVIKGLGGLLCKRGKYAEAVILFDKVDPKSVWQSKMFYDMTLAYAKQGRKSTAFVCAELALNRCPDMHLSHQAIANLGTGKFEAAKSNAWQAVTLAPRNKSAWNNFGLINNVMKDYETAYKAFSTSMAITGTNDQTCVMKFGRTCMFMKKYDEAEWAFKKALELNPNNDRAKIYLKRLNKIGEL